MRAYFWPERAVWETTLRCNLNCRHCGSVAGAARVDELSTAEALRVCDGLAEAGCRHVTLSGGETLLRDDWPDIVRRLLHHGLLVGIITNGLALVAGGLNLRRLRELADEAPRLHVGISVDGLEATHDFIRNRPGAFQIAVSAIDATLERGIPAAVLTTVNSLNLPELRRLRDEIVFGRPVYAWQVQTSNFYGRIREHADWFLSPAQYQELAAILIESRRLRQVPRTEPADCIGYMSDAESRLRDTTWRGCQAGIRAVGIQSNGSVKGCLSILDDGFVEGSLRRQTLLEIWDRPGGFAYNREFTPEMLGGLCAGCVHGRQCAGGCSAVSHSLTGAVHQAPYCLYAFECVQQAAAR